ncbi:TPA: hypothetical protein L4U56_003962 [Pseudomonas aeruginosa]|nr:hypothetical protein [Pseudomonas aeruginosa]
MRNPDISLTPKEKALFSEIRFKWKNHEELQDSLVPMESLAASVLQRGGVPERRVSYFTDPEFNPASRGKSRRDIFEKNGTSGNEILKHPNFLKYLEYFICGPDLPSTVLEKFKSESRSGHLSGSDLNDLTPYARSCVRQYLLEPRHAAEEFFKLAVECGAMPGYAENLRKSVGAVRLR